MTDSIARLVTAAQRDPVLCQAEPWRRQLNDEIPALILDRLDRADPLQRSPRCSRQDALRRVRAVLEAREEEPISVRELCIEAEVGARTLQRTFLERFGVGPKSYLQARRLNAVRRELREASPKTLHIVDVANRWGFWHIGQFAADYRHLFGELPSQTLGGTHAVSEPGIGA